MWIEDMTTKKQILQVLAKITQTAQTAADPFWVYQKAYDETIRKIDGQKLDQRQLAKRALGWITHAQRPLKIEELCYVLVVEEDADSVDEDNLTTPDDIVSACAGLVVINE
jgi:hypothetical protein